MAIGVFLLLKYYLDYDIKDALGYTTKLLLSILAFCTLLYHLHNLENQIKTQKESNRQNLAKYTYDICSDYRKPYMIDHIINVRELLIEQEELLNGEDKMKEFIKILEDDKDRRKSLILILNSGMVLAGDLNIDIVKGFFVTLFIRYYDRLKYYIEYIQEKESPKSCCNFEELCKKWKKENKK